MAAVGVQLAPTKPTPQLPDYVTDANAVLKDDSANWRYKKAPDYSKTRTVFAETKKMNHEAGSLPDLVQNLVKNWEIEASFKTNLTDWRTIDPEKYSFGVNGGPPQTGEHMLKVGTYNAVIGANEYYSPNHSDFASSHKTFKRMMPTFAWEVIEVYSGPPTVSFKWRHWGVMKNDYVGFNNKGEKVTAKAHGGPIEVEGVTVATVNDKLQLQKVETWFDSLEMFRQIAPNGVVNKAPINTRVSLEDNVTTDVADKIAAAPSTYTETAAPLKEVATDSQEHVNAMNEDTSSESSWTKVPSQQSASALFPTSPHPSDDNTNGNVEDFYNAEESHTESTAEMIKAIDGAHRDRVDEHLERPATEVHPHPKDTETAVQPKAGEAVASAKESEESIKTRKEMMDSSVAACPFLMNRE